MKTDRHSQSSLPYISRFESPRGRPGGRIRSALVISGAAILIAASYRLFYFLADYAGAFGAALSVSLFAAVFVITAYRMLARSDVAIFLMSVESEASKITWLTWPELKRSTLVVLCSMIAFSVFLFCCDTMWHLLLNSLSILKLAG